MLNPMEVLQRYKDDLEAKGHTVYAIMLKGSQNYNLSDEESDVDANAILIPSLTELRSDKSYKYSYDTGEVTCHNIYSFMDIASKGNPQWIEVCHTEYWIGDSLDLFKHYIVNPSALKGMMMEKVFAFSKLYPSRAKIVEKFGYDPKQLHHIIRLYDIMSTGKRVLQYHGERREYMMQIKRGTLLTKEEAFLLRDEYVEKLNALYQEKKIQYIEQTSDYSLLDPIVLSYLTQIVRTYNDETYKRK